MTLINVTFSGYDVGYFLFFIFYIHYFLPVSKTLNRRVWHLNVTSELTFIQPRVYPLCKLLPNCPQTLRLSVFLCLSVTLSLSLSHSVCVGGARAHARTNAHTYARTHARTHTHTHTLARFLLFFIFVFN